MTEADRDLKLGKLLREYGDARAAVTRLRFEVNRAGEHLTRIDVLLQDSKNENKALDILWPADIAFISSACEQLPELRQAIVRRRDLRTEVNNLGYGEHIAD